MRLYCLFCSVLFIPLILGTDENTTNLEHKSSTATIPKKSTKTVHNANNTLITEGGAIIQNKPSLNETLVHKELGIQSHSTIARRKGVSFNNDTDLPVKNVNATDHEIDKSVKTEATDKKTVSDSNKSSTTGTSTTIEPTVKPKVTKPPLLSSEALDKLDLEEKTAESSHKRLSSSASAAIPKVHPTSQHPGMVMPLVIGVLVVPMFAVLGYMALRRGQEAWKNRHYKRMDFLLDGMYNE